MQTIKLQDPITIDNVTYDELNIRRPKVCDRLAVERMKKTDAEKEIAMIANLAEVDIRVIEELDLADYGKIQQSFADFFPRRQRYQTSRSNLGISRRRH